MKILLVSNEYTKPGRIGNPIVYHLQNALKNNQRVFSVDFVPFQNSLRSFYKIRKAAKSADIIHVQFGGLYAFLVWFCLLGIQKPKLLTFHGTDIHAKEVKTAKNLLLKIKIMLNQKASFCSIILYDKLGFVANTMMDYVPNWLMQKYKSKMFIQPLGVDYQLFQQIDTTFARKVLGIEGKKWVLFSDKSNTPIKRRDIAKAIIDKLDDSFELLIMCNVNPSDVPIYINASDFVLLTSDEEGSPNIIREALSLNKRVFSVDVGDVKLQIEGLKDSAIISRDPREAANVIKMNLSHEYTDNTRETMRNKIDFEKIADYLANIYSGLLNK